MCPVPLIDLPEELMKVNSSSEEELPNQAVSFVRNMNVSLRLYLGFIMDKFTSLRNISKTKPNLKVGLIPFHFECDQTPVTFDPTINPLIKIKVM